MFEHLPKQIRIVEVGPRDGLQNEATPVATSDKWRFVELLAESGLNNIELTSFVRPDRIPQLSDAKELSAMMQASPLKESINFSALVPNMKGMEAAVAAGMREVAVFVATSETFSQKNINALIDASFERLAPVLVLASEHGIKVRGYLSTVFGCPYEGEVPPAKVVEVTQRLLEIGCYEVSLGDTTGVGTPGQVKEVLSLLLASVPAERLALHFHDTRGMALANMLVALEMGIGTYDASCAGLGGCPYAKGASGNVATEEVVYLAESLGIQTGVELNTLVAAGDFMLQRLGRDSASKLHRVIRQD